MWCFPHTGTEWVNHRFSAVPQQPSSSSQTLQNLEHSEDSWEGRTDWKYVWKKWGFILFGFLRNECLGFSQPFLGNWWPVLSSATDLCSSLNLLTFLDLGLQDRWSFFPNSERHLTWRDSCWRKFHFYLFILLTYLTENKHAEAQYFKN